MAAINNLITLTAVDSISGFTGTIRLGADQIVSFRGSGSGAVIYYNENSVELKWVVVSETPAAVATASGTHIAVTATSINGQSQSSITIYINANLITLVALDTISGTGSNIRYFNPQAVSEDIYIVTETPAAVQTAVAAILASGGSAPVTGLTAFAGGGQGSATQLSYGYNEVTVVATAGDSVKLQAAQAGAITTVLNDGANAMDVFPATGDTINDGAANVAISVAPGVQITFTGINSTNWETSSQVISTSRIVEAVAGQGVTMQDITIFEDVNISSNATGITAFATGGQGSATQLTKEYNNVTVCATAGDSVKLLTAVAGLTQIVRNSGAANLEVFPFLGDTINGGSVNTSVVVSRHSQVTFKCISGTDWKTDTVTIQADTIRELTADNGIDVDGLTVKDGGFTATIPNSYSTETGVTAFATGGQASATALTKEYNNVTVVATAADSVKLLAAAVGIRQIVKNNGSADLAVFPSTGDTIDGGAANASITMTPGTTRIFSAIDSTDWETSSQVVSATRVITGAGTVSAPGLVVGVNDNGQYEVSSTQQGFSIGNALVGGYNANGLFSSSLEEQVVGVGINVPNKLVFGEPNQYSTATGITAFATGGQASATALTKEISNITVCATNGDSVKLLPAAVGLKQIVRNSVTNRSVDVFPSTGDSINALAVNLAISIPPRCEVVFESIDGVVWKTNNESLSALNNVYTDNLTEKTAGAGISVTSIMTIAGVKTTGEAIDSGYLYTGTISTTGAGTPQTLNTLVGTVEMTGVNDIAAGASVTVVINNTIAAASTIGIVSLQTTTAAAGSTPRIESVVYGVGTITIVLRNSAAATATGAATYKFSFQLFKI